MSASLDKSQAPPPAANPELPAPYLTAGGTLVIPFNSDPKFHYWNGGQKVAKTMASLRVLPMADTSEAPARTT